MALTAVQRILLGTGIGIVVIFTTAGRGDPPVDVAGGSIHGIVKFFHIWHKSEDTGASYWAAKTPDNTQIVITDGNYNTLLACTASQWVVTLYSVPTDIAPTAKFCTNNQCDANKPVDAEGKLYLNSYSVTALGGGKKRWKHSWWGIAWWKIEFEDDKVHVDRVELRTAGPTVGDHPCPESWPTALSKGVTDYHWHVQIGQPDVP